MASPGTRVPSSSLQPQQPFETVGVAVAGPVVETSAGLGAPAAAAPLPFESAVPSPPSLPPQLAGSSVPDGVVRVVVDADLTVDVVMQTGSRGLASAESVDVVLDGTRQALEPLRGLAPELRQALGGGGTLLGSFTSHERHRGNSRRGHRYSEATESSPVYAERGELVNAVA